MNLPFDEVKAETELLKETRSHLVILDIFQRCSREFGITFSPDDVKQIHTVSQLANAVVENIVAKKKAGMREAISSPVSSQATKTVMFGLPFILWSISFASINDAWMSLLLVAVFAVLVSARSTKSESTFYSQQPRKYYFLGALVLILLISIMSVLLSNFG